ncbi:hypothetical protein [Siphonobacter sp.]|uniref:hypothetical protein n=1 Tax=Siphonobacter sp. TaxID=1869184 RepID=UPI003B3A45A5
MRIEPFGTFDYHPREQLWKADVDHLSPTHKVELSIGTDHAQADLSDKIKLLEAFVLDYASIMERLYQFIYESYRKTSEAKTLEEIKTMYFLTAVTLQKDNRTWWLVLEPNFDVPTLYSHFQRFTMVERQIVPLFSLIPCRIRLE